MKMNDANPVGAAREKYQKILEDFDETRELYRDLVGEMTEENLAGMKLVLAEIVESETDEDAHALMTALSGLHIKALAMWAVFGVCSALTDLFEEKMDKELESEQG